MSSPEPSAAYVVLRTDASDGLEGHALPFTTGCGNDVQAAAIAALAPYVVGRSVDEVCGDLGACSRPLVHDPQLRWPGPEKDAIHRATGAVVNAAWHLAAKRADKPVRRFLGELTPEEHVAQVDFRWMSDALTPEEALELLRRAEPGRQQRVARLLERGCPACTTTPGWLGYSDEKPARLSREAVADGFTQIKLRAGASLEDDVHRMPTAREAAGDGIRIAVDATQRWDLDPAIDWMRAPAPYDPYWIEEPTSPDGILGHAAVREAVRPVKAATGEHITNRVVSKQLLQAGGVGLCEMVQHLSMFDYVAVSGTVEDRVVEYVDHLHEHVVDPVRVTDGRYLAPALPGFGAQRHQESSKEYTYPDGPVWSARV